MRTTLDLDDDILQAARERAARGGVSIGRALSDMARQSLTAPAGQAARRAARSPLGIVPLPKRKDVVTLEHIRRLRDAEGI
jgi:hypothetical protein